MDTLYSPCSSKPSCLKFNIVTTYIAEVLVQLSWCIFIYLHPQLLMQFLAYIKKQLPLIFTAQLWLLCHLDLWEMGCVNRS